MSQFGFRFDSTYPQLPEAFLTMMSPQVCPAPQMVIFNADLAAELGLDIREADQAELFSGNVLPERATPFAQAYAGHQFGYFTILGDGRAIVWGEHLTPDGRRVDIQFKGSGRTPYSRRGDGRAALGPMLREYILSEAMQALGIPTTRSLAVATTGETVLRYVPLPGAILTRVASSHIRVGTFEYAAAHRKLPLLQALFDYTLQRHYPELEKADNPALALLQAVMARQIDLVVEWLRVGFIHGVMNTDNMALSGETIDYGPCAFMEAYSPQAVFSSIDEYGRYAYGNQPAMVQWNLARLAEALLPLLHEDTQTAITMAEETIESFEGAFRDKWLAMMGRKLGLSHTNTADEDLVTDLLNWMQEHSVDFTNTFVDFSQSDLPDNKLYQSRGFRDWYGRWQARKPDLALMRQANPVVIPRNHRVEQALDAAEAGDLSLMWNLLDALQSPYDYDQDRKGYQSPPSPGERVYQTFCGT